jgi:hypothetical protein
MRRIELNKILSDRESSTQRTKTMMIWSIMSSDALGYLGFIPDFLSEDDPAPAKKQLHDNYPHGGGWRPMDGFKMSAGDVLHYPGDPPFKPKAMTMLRDEKILVYQYAFVAIVQTDGSFEVARMD